MKKIQTYSPYALPHFDLYVDGYPARVFEVKNTIMGHFMPGFYLEKLIRKPISYDPGYRESIPISYARAVLYQSGFDPETQLFL